LGEITQNSPILPDPGNTFRNEIVHAESSGGGLKQAKIKIAVISLGKVWSNAQKQQKRPTYF